MPIDYKLYPKNWKELRKQVLERAENKCEFCGVENYSVGARDLNGKFHLEDDIHHLNSNCGFQLFGGNFNWKMTKIILTIAHLDHDKENHDVSIDRLKALCQKCHLQYDMPRHVENRKKNLVEKKGLQNLFIDNGE